MTARDPDDSEAPPQATLKRRNLTWVWAVPVVAALIGGWLAFQGLSARGPTIKITFMNAEGIEAGRTKIRHKNVDVGIVKAVKLEQDFSTVDVEAELQSAAADHLTTGTKFWVVRPRVGFGGISGLGTLVSGAYIEMQPGDGDGTRDFKGLEDPPRSVPVQPGRSYELTTDRLGDVAAGAPIYYHGVGVGQVLDSRLDQGSPAPGDEKVKIGIYIFDPYNGLIHPDTRFWSVTGIQISAGSGGIKLSVASLQSIVAGGLAFDSVPNLPGAKPDPRPAPEGTAFALYADEPSARGDFKGPTLTAHLEPEDGVKGLNLNAAVFLMGMPVGWVSSIGLVYDPATDRLSTPVTIQLIPQQLLPGADMKGDPVATARAALGRMLARGLTASFASENLLSGAKNVALAFPPTGQPSPGQPAPGKSSPGRPASTTPQPPPSPDTIPMGSGGGIDDVTRAATRTLNEVTAMDLPALSRSLRETLNTANARLDSPEVKRLLASLDHIAATLDTATRTELPALLAELRQTLAAADSLLGGGNAPNRDLSSTIHELKDTVRSFKALADYLERHPEALISGKKEEPK